MRLLLVTFLAAAVTMAAGEKKGADKSAPKPADKGAAKTEAKTSQREREKHGIPKEAKEVSPGRFRHVDKDGKIWMYEITPFGMMKGEAPPDDPNKEIPIPDGLTVEEDGDTLKFSRPWPFGGRLNWTRKKTELTEMEQEAWRRAQEAKRKQ